MRFFREVARWTAWPVTCRHLNVGLLYMNGGHQMIDRAVSISTIGLIRHLTSKSF